MHVNNRGINCSNRKETNSSQWWSYARVLNGLIALTGNWGWALHAKTSCRKLLPLAIECCPRIVASCAMPSLMHLIAQGACNCRVDQTLKSWDAMSHKASHHVMHFACHDTGWRTHSCQHITVQHTAHSIVCPIPLTRSSRIGDLKPSSYSPATHITQYIQHHGYCSVASPTKSSCL